MRLVEGGGEEKARGSNSIPILRLCLFYGQSFKQARSVSFVNFVPRLHYGLKRKRKLFATLGHFLFFRHVKKFSFHDLLRNEKCSVCALLLTTTFYYVPNGIACGRVTIRL